MSLIIEDKDGYHFIVWSINRKAVKASNKISCNDVICGKKTCEGCVFSLEINNSYDRNLEDFKIIQS